MNASKYHTLYTAKKAGVSIPPMLYLKRGVCEQQELDSFLHAHPSKHYIVRSAVSIEDQTTQSYAGYFTSSEAVSENDLPTIIQAIREKNEKRLEELGDVDATANLIISPFVHSVCGGVLFTPWLYFHNHCLLEYAASPQHAVAGINTTALVLPLDGAAQNTKLNEVLVHTLQNEIKKIKKIFSFPLDIEWAFDGTNLYILQNRPITIAPTALQTVPLESYVTPDVYSTDTYHGSLGKLSPLSFSILEHLYTHATHYQNTLQLRGGENFLHRLPTGDILTHKNYEKTYFSHKKWYAPFLVGLQKQTIIQRLQADAQTFTPNKVFDLKHTQYAFDRWRISDSIARSHDSYATPFEYEIGSSIPIESYPENTLTQIWKKRFLETLLPLRDEVKKSPERLWGNITDPVAISPDQYQKELPQSLYTIASSSTSASSYTHGSTKGKLFLITNPYAWRGPLPKECIIATPYIPVHWIHELRTITGIVCTSLGTLSHAAITLREHKVPTKVVTDEEFGRYETGAFIEI